MTKCTSVLYKDIYIGKLRVHNRLVVPAMTSGFAKADGSVSERLIKYLENRAKGGFGLIITEGTAIDSNTGMGAKVPLLRISDDKFIKGFKDLANRIHQSDSKVIVQLYHPGRCISSTENGGLQPIAPSALADPVWRQEPRQLPVKEIIEIIELYAQAARRAREAGIDGIELHGAHGFLISQFMSAYANKRMDVYGGDFEGYLRFPLEIIQRIRHVIGTDYPILFRISSEEGVQSGRKLEETIEVAKRLVKAGISALNVSYGVQQSSNWTSPPADVEQGFNSDASLSIKRSVSVPIIIAGRIIDPEVAAMIVQNNKSDMVALGRQSICDPAWPDKVARGMENEIIKCISCSEGCLGMLMQGKPIACVQNMGVGIENKIYSCKLASPKKVIVAGGGPAGLEAARTAARIGHHVTIFEKSNSLGGSVNLSAIPPMKSIYSEVISSRVSEIEKLGVEIRLNLELTCSLVEKMCPDILVVATGSKPLIPDIDSITGNNVLLAADVLTGAKTGDSVVVLGGGLVGCEVADYLIAQNKTVTIIEVQPQIARDMYPAHRYFLIRRLRERDARIITSATVRSIRNNEVVIEIGGNHTESITTDTVIIAIGFKPNNELAIEAKNFMKNIYLVGDAAKPGKILQAVQQARNIFIDDEYK